MKIRSGFVSNSSSSSFVVIGYRIKDKDGKEFFDKIKKELYPEGIDEDDEDDINWEVRNHIEEEYGIVFVDAWECSFKAKKGESIVGVVLSDISSEDCGGEDMEIKPEDFEKKTKVIRDNFKVNSSPSLFIGTRSC